MPKGKLTHPVWAGSDSGVYVIGDEPVIPCMIAPFMSLDADAWDWRLGPYDGDDVAFGVEWRDDLDEWIIDLE